MDLIEPIAKEAIQNISIEKMDEFLVVLGDLAEINLTNHWLYPMLSLSKIGCLLPSFDIIIIWAIISALECHLHTA